MRPKSDVLQYDCSINRANFRRYRFHLALVHQQCSAWHTQTAKSGHLEQLPRWALPCAYHHTLRRHSKKWYNTRAGTRIWCNYAWLEIEISHCSFSGGLKVSPLFIRSKSSVLRKCRCRISRAVSICRCPRAWTKIKRNAEQFHFAWEYDVSKHPIRRWAGVCNVWGGEGKRAESLW